MLRYTKHSPASSSIEEAISGSNESSYSSSQSGSCKKVLQEAFPNHVYANKTNESRAQPRARANAFGDKGGFRGFQKKKRNPH